MSCGFGSQVHYLPVPMHPFYSNNGYTMNNFPNAKHYYEECLSIPLYYDLSDVEQQFVMNTLIDLIEK
jgi:dTDP-4-amino-4,6-dideoxygalactose transaminase